MGGGGGGGGGGSIQRVDANEARGASAGPSGSGGGGGGTRLSKTVLRAKYERFEKHWLVFLKLLNFKSDLFQSRTTLFYKFGECQCHY